MVLLPVDSPSSDSLTLPGHSPIVASKDMQSSPCGPLPQEQLVEEFNSSDTSEVVEAAEEADVVNDSRSSDLASLSWQEPSSPWTVEVSKQNFDILHMKLERAIFESERSLQKAEIAQNQLKVKNRTISRLEEKMEHMQHRLSHMAQLEIEIKGLNLKLMNEEDGRRTFFREAEELRQANVLLEAKLEEARECLEDALQDRILASFKLKKVEKQLNYDCNCDGKLRLKYERVRRQLDSLLSRDLMRGCFHALQHELARACQHRQRAIASGGRLQRRSLTCILAGWTEYVLMRRKKKACREVVERSVKSERAHLCLWALWLVRGQSLDQNFSAMLHSRTSRRDLQAKRAALSVWSSCTRTGYEVAKAVKHLSLHHEITLRTRQTRSHFFYLWRFTLQLDRRLQAECEHVRRRRERRTLLENLEGWRETAAGGSEIGEEVVSEGRRQSGAGAGAGGRTQGAGARGNGGGGALPLIKVLAILPVLVALLMYFRRRWWKQMKEVMMTAGKQKLLRCLR